MIQRRGSLTLGLLTVALVVAGCRPSTVDEVRTGDAELCRVCSVSLAADEMLFGLGVQDRVVAVSRFADNLGYSNVVGRFEERVVRLTADLELIVKVRPDLLVVSPYNSQDFLNVIDGAGIKTYRTRDVNSWQGIEDSIVGLGEQLGVSERADVILRECQQRLARVAHSIPEQDRLRVLAWSTDMVTNGEKTTIGEMIVRAGGINVAEELGLEGMTQISAERVLKAAPDVLLLGSDDPFGMSALPPAYKDFPRRHGIRVVAVPVKLLTSVSQYFVEGVELLAARLYGADDKRTLDAGK